MSKKKTKAAGNAPVKPYVPYRDLVCFDFDGVLSEGRGYHWPLDNLNLSLIREAWARGYAAAIMTCNDTWRVAAELRKHHIAAQEDPYMTQSSWSGGQSGRVVLITQRKLSAKFYVDDRAIPYTYGQDTKTAVWDQIDIRSGYHPCPVHRHWGPRGAAGVLPFAVWHGQVWVLLAKRAKWVQDGGTWASFSGAIDQGETAWDAAMREAGEEVSGLEGFEDSGWNHVFTHECGWTFTMYPVHVPLDEAGLLPPVRLGTSSHSSENTDLRWVPLSRVDSYDLHPAFADSWPQYRAAVENAAGEPGPLPLVADPDYVARITRLVRPVYSYTPPAGGAEPVTVPGNAVQDDFDDNLGECWGCSQFYELRADGMIPSHDDSSGIPCIGTGQYPAAPDEAAGEWHKARA